MPNRSTREGANRAGRLAAVVLFPITALASWCLIGPSTAGTGPSMTYDYMFRASVKWTHWFNDRQERRVLPGRRT